MRGTTNNAFKLSDEEKENFGFFDDVPSISPNSVMETFDIEEKEEVQQQVSLNQEEKVEEKQPVVKRQKASVVAADDSDEANTNKKGVANNNNSIRVNLDKIDLLMNNVGDLVITNAMLTQFSINGTALDALKNIKHKK